jgi:hypothetical protein
MNRIVISPLVKGWSGHPDGFDRLNRALLTSRMTGNRIDRFGIIFIEARNRACHEHRKTVHH